MTGAGSARWASSTTKTPGPSGVRASTTACSAAPRSATSDFVPVSSQSPPGCASARHAISAGEPNEAGPRSSPQATAVRLVASSPAPDPSAGPPATSAGVATTLLSNGAGSSASPASSRSTASSRNPPPPPGVEMPTQPRPTSSAHSIASWPPNAPGRSGSSASSWMRAGGRRSANHLRAVLRSSSWSSLNAKSMNTSPVGRPPAAPPGAWGLGGRGGWVGGWVASGSGGGRRRARR